MIRTAIACLIVTAATSAWAQAQVADETALLQKGAELLAQHKDAEALAVFEEAYAIKKSPRSLAQVGVAEGALGRWLAADEHIGAAIERKDDPWIAKHAAALAQARAVVGEHIGELEVEGNIPGAEVRVDDRICGTLPLSKPLRLVAGSAVITVSATGYVAVTRTIRMTARTRNRETVELVKLPVIAPPHVPPTTEPGPAPMPPPTSKKPLWTALGITAGMVVIGGVTAGLLLGIPNNAPDLMTDLGSQPVRF